MIGSFEWKTAKRCGPIKVAPSQGTPRARTPPRLVCLAHIQKHQVIHIPLQFEVVLDPFGRVSFRASLYIPTFPSSLSLFLSVIEISRERERERERGREKDS